MSSLFQFGGNLPENIETFINQVEDSFEGSAESLWKVERSFKSLVNDYEVWAELVNEHILSLIESGVSHGMWQEFSLELHHCDKFQLRVSTSEYSVADYIHGYENQSDYLISSARHTLLGYIGESSIEVDIYQLEAGSDFDIADPDMQVEKIRSHTLASGGILRIDGTKELLAIRSIPKNSCFVVLNSREVQVQQCTFHNETRKFIGASMSSEFDSRLKTMIELVSRYDDKSAIPSLLKLCEHKNHYVRWAAVTSLSKLEPALGFQEIKRATLDPHPHISMAAKKTINTISEVEHG